MAIHRIVVVGGGAGGLELATQLGDRYGRGTKAHVTLVDGLISDRPDVTVAVRNSLRK